MMSRLCVLIAALCLFPPVPAVAQDNRPVSLILRFTDLPDRVNRTFEDGQLTLVIGAWEFQPPREEPVHALERQQAVFVVPWFDIQDTSIDCFRVDIEGAVHLPGLHLCSAERVAAGRREHLFRGALAV